MEVIFEIIRCEWAFIKGERERDWELIPSIEETDKLLLKNNQGKANWKKPRRELIDKS